MIEYVIFSYATVWNNGRYYLADWSDRRKMVVTFRVDRMQETKQLSRKRIPAS